MADVKWRHQLGLTLLKELCKEEKDNVVFSPLSLGTAFAMLAAGLKGNTKDELLNFVGCNDQDVVDSLYSGMVSNKDLPLKIANKYIAQDNIKVQEKFSNFLRVSYCPVVRFRRLKAAPKTVMRIARRFTEPYLKMSMLTDQVSIRS